MNLGSFFSKIPGVVGKVASTAFAVLKIAKPWVDALAQVIPFFHQAKEEINEQLHVGGHKAGEFLVANIDTIRKLGQLARRMVLIWQAIIVLCDKLEKYAMLQTPGEITEEEALDLAFDLGLLDDEMKEAAPVLEEMSEKLAAVV